MNLLFVVDSFKNNKGGGVIAPKLIGDVLYDFYEIKTDFIFFKESNIWRLLFKFNFSKPKYNLLKSNKSIIEIESLIQLFFWFRINQKNYNLFVLHGIWAPIYIFCSFFCIFFKKPFCFHPHGSLDPYDINKKKKYIKLILGFIYYKIIFKFSSGIIFTSSLEAFRSRTFGVKIPRYTAILTSPDKTNNRPLSNSIKKILLHKYKISKEKNILLFLNRIDPKKGLDILLKSLSLINLKKIPFVLLIAGIGKKKYLNYIKRLIVILNLEKHIRILGHIDGDEKNQIFKLSDLFILPTLNENFGISIIEAIQNKLPVLITKNVYIYENIINSKAGYLCNRDPYQLANLIEDILINSKHKKFIHTEECFNKNFSRNNCAIQHFQIYSGMVK